MDLSSSQRLDNVIRIARSDATARDRLLALYRPYLRVVAEKEIGAALRRREDASDVVQRTMFEASEGLSGFRGETEPEFSAWIERILRHNVANAVRDHRAARRDLRREQHPTERGSSASLSWQFAAAHQTSPSLRVVKAEAALRLAAALELLPVDQRQAVAMRHLEGRSMADIAAAMEKSPAAVAGLLRRGVARLRAELADESWG